MKRTLKWLGSLALALVLCILIFPALTTEADAASVDDLTYLIKNGEVTIINCSSQAVGSLAIPSTIEGYPVTKINIRAFAFCDHLKAVTIPSSVTTIDKGAFYGCLGLQNVYYCGSQSQWQSVSIDWIENDDLRYATKIYVQMVKKGNDWYCYRNGKLDTRADTLQWYNDTTYHLKNGKWQQGETRLYKYGSEYYYLVNGVVNYANKLVQFDGKWYHVKDGTWQQGEHTLFKYSGKWYYLYNGIMNKTDKLMRFNNKLYHVKDGTWQQGENKLYKYNGKWYALSNGVVNTADTLFSFNNTLYHIKHGYWQQGEKTLYSYDGELYYLDNGIVNTTEKLFNYGGQWYHIKDGVWQQGEYGLVKFNFHGKYYAMSNGIVNMEDTLFSYDGKLYHIKLGFWQQYEAAKLYKYAGEWCYLTNGIVNMSDTLFTYEGKLYHVKNGVWQQGETTLYKHNGQWYYLQNGVVNKSTTVCVYNNKLYYVTGGKWVRTNTTFTYNGNTLKVTNGMVTGADKVTIIQQPESVVGANGEKATVTVLAVGDGLKYTWYYMDEGQSSYTKTTSFTGNTYSIEMNTARNGRRVRCVITDKYGNTVKTVTATLGMSGTTGESIVLGKWYLMDLNTLDVYYDAYITFYSDNTCNLVAGSDSYWTDWEYYGYIENTYVYLVDYGTSVFVVEPETDIAGLTIDEDIFFFTKT